MSVLRGPRVGAAPGFEEFVAERLGPMRGLARVLVRHPQQAEDLVQEVLASVLVKWSRVSAAEDPAAYANRMLVNAATSWRRRPSRREIPALLDEDRPTPDASGSSDARLALLAALRTLSARQRAVLALRYLEDWPDDDVADATGLSPSGVRSCAQRGLAALRASGALDGYGAVAGGVGAVALVPRALQR